MNPLFTWLLFSWWSQLISYINTWLKWTVWTQLHINDWTEFWYSCWFKSYDDANKNFDPKLDERLYLGNTVVYQNETLQVMRSEKLLLLFIACEMNARKVWSLCLWIPWIMLNRSIPIFTQTAYLPFKICHKLQCLLNDLSYRQKNW